MAPLLLLVHTNSDLCRHTLGGNVSNLLWWPAEQDMYHTNDAQTSKQLLLSAQLVNFISPARCDAVGVMSTSQVIDLNLDEYAYIEAGNRLNNLAPQFERSQDLTFALLPHNRHESREMRSVELDLLVPLADVTPTLRVMLILRNKRADSELAEVVAIHVLKLFERDGSRFSLRQGMLEALLLNLAHPQDGVCSELEWDHPLRAHHEYSHGIPHTLWDIITYLPESSYSTSQWTGQKTISPFVRRKDVWLNLSIQSNAQPSLLSPQIETSSAKATDAVLSISIPEEGDTTSIVDLTGDFVSDDLPELLVANIETNTAFGDYYSLETVGDIFDPKWKNPAQRKFDRQMERLAAQNSWDITPGPEDQIKLDLIEHKFAAWAPLTEGDKELVWKYRGHLKRTLKPLFLFASCVKWNSPAHVEDAMNLIYGSQDTTKNDQQTDPSISAFMANTPSSFKKITPRDLKPRSSIALSSLEGSPAPMKTPTGSSKLVSAQTPSSGRLGTIVSPSAHRGPFSPVDAAVSPSEAQGSRSNSITPPLPTSTPNHPHPPLQRSTSASKSSNLLTSRSAVMEESWRCLDVIDVLPMLTWRHAPALRKFIIQRVLKDANLEPIILQVIHALKYEDAPPPVPINEPFIIHSENYSGLSFERMSPDTEYANAITKQVEPEVPKVETPLLDLLIDRASVQPLGYYIYWYMSADQELITQFDTLTARLKGTSIWVTIQQQMMIHEAIKRIGRECINIPDDLRVQAINELVRQCGLFDLADLRVPLPLHPSLVFRMIRPTSSHVFSSSNKPIKLTLDVIEASSASSHLSGSSLGNSSSGTPSSHLGRSSSRLGSSMATSPSGIRSPQSTGPLSPLGASLAARRDLSQSNFASTSNSSFASALSSSAYIPPVTQEYDIIYKHGDDLRHDQLMMLLIRLIDRELQRHNLDLNFVSYDVLPFSINDGIMTCITKTMAIEDIRRKKNMALSAYLRKYNPSEEEYERALNTYAKSCAGNCVLNMVLGWGDRHAANLLVAQDGHLVHIDFGFILGHEPNWNIFKIMLSLTDYMLEPLGTDPNSPMRRQFYSYAHDAYQVLRKFGHRILSILYVMRSALAEKDVPDTASLESINFVRDRLNLILSDDDAVAKLNEALESAPSNIKQSMSTWWRALKHG